MTLRTLRVLSLSLALVAGPALAAQNTLPGGHDSNASQQRAAYEAAMRANVDTLLIAWQRAFDEHDSKELAELYEPTAVITLSTGSQLRGRNDIKWSFDKSFARMRHVRITLADFTLHDGEARVHGTMTSEVLADGGGYSASIPIAFVLRPNSWERFVIHEQEGGDILAIVALSHPISIISTAAPQTMRVRVVDVTGKGVNGATVTFGSSGGRGTIDPAIARTDAEGVATATFVPASIREIDTVSAQVAGLPNEPAIFRFRLLDPAMVTAARNLLITMGARLRLDSMVAGAIDARRAALPNVPAEFWSGLGRQSAVAVALDSLAPLYAENLSMGTMRSMDSVFRTPAGQEWAAAQPLIGAEIASVEKQWRAMLEGWLTAQLQAQGYLKKN